MAGLPRDRAVTLEKLHTSLRPVRAEVWRRSAATQGKAPVILDIDASLVDIHSEFKEATAATYKGNYGFHPIFCFADATGECLAELLRPGNATANAVVDNLAVLDGALEALGEGIIGRRQVIVRSDSAGCSEGFMAGCRSREVSFMVVARTNAQVQGAIFDAVGLEECWRPTLRQDGGLREGASVIELTDLVDLSRYPGGTRLIVRREPLHPGAQQSLFKALDYRYWGFYTDCDGDPVDLDVTIRAHAHVEDHILRLKESGMLRFPFSTLAANRAWLFVVALAADLVRWFQLLCLDGALAKARPKALRWSFLHAPGRLVHRGRRLVIRVLDHWPRRGRHRARASAHRHHHLSAYNLRLVSDLLLTRHVLGPALSGREVPNDGHVHHERSSMTKALAWMPDQMHAIPVSDFS